MTAPLSRAEILSLPPAIDLPTLGKALGLSEPTIREANRSGELAAMGIRVNKIGAQYRCVVASLWAYLGIASDGDASGVGSESRPRPAARQPRPTGSALRPVRGEGC
jgi:hypothetical protein